MPRLTPRAVAFAPREQQSVILAQAGKKYLLQLDDSNTLQPLRTVSAPSETFWIVEHEKARFALFWNIEKLSLQPLAGGRGKSLKSYDGGTFSRHVAFSNTEQWLGVENRHVYRFVGDRLDVVDGTDIDGHVWMASTGEGIMRRPIGGVPSDWKKVFGGSLQYLKSTAWDPDGDVFAVAEYSGRILFVDAQGTRQEVKLKNVWCIEHHDGEFYVWSDNAVQRLDRDGTLHDMGLTGEPNNDDCLVSTPQGLFFLEGTTVHRMEDGTWTAIELAAARLGLA